ncbi:MAG: nitroreductase family protein [Lachnospiraceae bacterium]|nr:nitroreductase family protein [Lachnospiraceae bacterium]
MEFQEVVKNRYSCKKYDGRQVDQSKLDAILEAGRLAPTAKNTQEQRVYVIRSEEALAKVDRATPCRYGASTVLAVAYDSKEVFTYPGGRYDSGAEDATIVATHLMLAAADAGVDSCWVNFFDPDVLARDLGLPDHERIVMLLDLGYAAEGTGPLPNHGSRKPIADTVTYI